MSIIAILLLIAVALYVVSSDARRLFALKQWSPAAERQAETQRASEANVS